MDNIYQLQQRADNIRQRTITDSITPTDIGTLHYDTLAYIALLEQNNDALGIRKIYTSYQQMIDDTTPTGTNGHPLRLGQLVIINDQSDANNNGNIYAYQNPGWQLAGRINDIPQLLSLLDNIQQSKLPVNISIETHDTSVPDGKVTPYNVYKIIRLKAADGTIIAQALINAYDSLNLFAGWFSALDRQQLNAATKNIQDNSSRIDTLHKASQIHDTRIQENKSAIKTVKDKLDEYPSQFILDLGTVSSQAEGESMAASSEVAGNRNISFIRFQVNGVSALKTTLILQWANGINETAQIKYIDKAEWRRNVTGATGVAGAATAATQWERTAPHYLGYDAATRKIQLKDYTQTVSRDVELPLATTSTAGLLSSTYYTKIQDCISAVTNHNAKLNDHDTRIQTLESIHAPSDMVEMTIQNDKAQCNVLFYKIEWIDDLEIDGRHVYTSGQEGKFYRSLSAGEHKVRFRVSAENQTKRGLLGLADDESAGYLSHVTRIVIPEGWTELPANCFEARKHLEEVVLPSTLRVIGGNCFQSLPALRELVIPENVERISWSAVNDCASLTMIRMGGWDTMPLEISYEAFRNCPALSCVEILPCRLTFTGSSSPFSNLPQLNSLICHLTTPPTFQPTNPFGTIGSGTTNRKTLYRPAGITFYDQEPWITQLRETLNFYVADL